MCTHVFTMCYLDTNTKILHIWSKISCYICIIFHLWCTVIELAPSVIFTTWIAVVSYLRSECRNSVVTSIRLVGHILKRHHICTHTYIYKIRLQNQNYFIAAHVRTFGTLLTNWLGSKSAASSSNTWSAADVSVDWVTAVLVEDDEWAVSVLWSVYAWLWYNTCNECSDFRVVFKRGRW